MNRSSQWIDIPSHKKQTELAHEIEKIDTDNSAEEICCCNTNFDSKSTLIQLPFLVIFSNIICYTCYQSQNTKVLLPFYV